MLELKLILSFIHLLLIVKLCLPVLLCKGVLGFLVSVFLRPALGVLVILVLTKIIGIFLVIAPTVIVQGIVIIRYLIPLASIVDAVLVIVHIQLVIEVLPLI